MTRRAPKRKAPAAKVDDTFDESLALVASVMAEEKSHGWFSHPWRDIRNAVLLAYDAAEGTALIEGRFADFCQDGGPPGAFNGAVCAAWRYLRAFVQETTAGSYIESGDHLAELLFDDDGVGRLTCAALRCHQLWVTGADGAVPNLVLDKVVYYRDSPVIESIVREARALDAIGTSTTLRNDAGDRTRRAFRYFWDHGFHAAAYRLKEVS